MKKFLFLILLIIFSCNEKDKIVENKTENLSFENSKENNPELLTFMFQPSLKENTEVILNFDKKYLTFRDIYPFIQEPPPPPNLKGESNSQYVFRKPIHPFVVNLTNEELSPIKSALSNLSNIDYQRIEGTEIDGTSYAFSILFSNQDFKVGFIANLKSDEQRKLINEILNLIKKKNNFSENEVILDYYSRY